MAQKFMVDSTHGIFGEFSSEPGEREMIRCRIVKGKTQKFFEGDAVIDLGFQFRVRIDIKSLLEQQTLHTYNRLVGPVAFSAFVDLRCGTSPRWC